MTKKCAICDKNYLKGITQILIETDGHGHSIRDDEVTLCMDCAPVHAEYFKQFVEGKKVKK